MYYQQFINEQQSLTDIGHAYKNDSEFKKNLDADPKSIFKGDMASTECEVIIKQNSDDVFYFTLTVDMNQGINDEIINNINAAKLTPLSLLGEHDAQLFQNSEDNKYYRRYKGDSSDPQGKTHFIEVASRSIGNSPFRDVSGEVVIIK